MNLSGTKNENTMIFNYVGYKRTVSLRQLEPMIGLSFWSSIFNLTCKMSVRAYRTRLRPIFWWESIFWPRAWKSLLKKHQISLLHLKIASSKVMETIWKHLNSEKVPLRMGKGSSFDGFHQANLVLFSGFWAKH